jgi:superfamily I DNA and/or RNA helicase
MHPEILSISNHLFYGNKIQNGYKYSHANKFLDKKHPVLIIDVKGEEYRHGTSIQNQAEAEVVS